MSEHVTASLFAYCAGELAPAESAAIARHLLECRACRAEHDAVRAGFQTFMAGAAVKAPADLWSSIESAIADRRPVVASPRVVPRSFRPIASLAASLLLVGGLASLGAYVLGVRSTSWAVERMGGTPLVGTVAIDDRGTLPVGEWLETDERSSARLRVGRLGRADIGPGSRVRLVNAGGTEHRLAMERGQMHATIWAPPRLFLVNTPSAEAIDLGCVYTLTVDDAGSGVLTVLSGQVELVRDGRRSLVTAGSAAAMQPGQGPGTPYAVDESEAFRAALDVLDRADSDASARTTALNEVLGSATPRSTISLWHLLSRVSADERGLVYDRLASLAPVPKTVTRDAVVALDKRALSKWQRALEPTWSKERVYIWKTAWRGLWSLLRSE
jgi:hypothetical protein